MCCKAQHCALYCLFICFFLSDFFIVIEASDSKNLEKYNTVYFTQLLFKLWHHHYPNHLRGLFLWFPDSQIQNNLDKCHLLVCAYEQTKTQFE